MLWQMFWLLLGIGALTFGGGYAIIPVIQSQVVDNLGWISAADFANGIAFGQLTPGPLSAMVAFVGYRVGGVAGAVVASVALLTPCLVAAAGLTAFAGRWRKVPRVQAALKGLTVAVVAMLGVSIVTLGRDNLGDLYAVLVAVAAFLLTGPLKKDPAWSLGLGAVVGAVVYGWLGAA
jgi:chromate transporter